MRLKSSPARCAVVPTPELAKFRVRGRALASAITSRTVVAGSEGCTTIPSVIQHVKSGKLRAIAVTGRQRSSEMPEVPTVIESGLRDFEVTSWFGLFAPAGTPRAVIERLNRESVAALAQADVRQKMAGHGVDAANSTPEALGQLLSSEIERWGKVIREAGIKAE